MFWSLQNNVAGTLIVTRGSELPTPDLPSLDHLHVDIAIIGAGINGASAAQHLSAAGYRVLVVDQGDFANGATSRSSRLLHCGLRHLATGTDFWQSLLRPDRLAKSMKTVRDDMLARDEIVHTIPNRVKPIKFCIPIYDDDQYSPWQMDAAFAALRLTSPRGVPLDYQRYSPTSQNDVPISPWLRDPDKLRSVAVFREYIFDWPERIALDAVFDARRMGAIVRNYTRVVDLKQQGQDPRWHLTLQSAHKITPSDSDTACVTADLVLNLAGAWVDDLIHQTGSNAAPKCTGIKGIHIALRLPEEFNDWGVFTYNSLGEPLYCLPFRGVHYVGLTRTPFTGDIAGVSASDQEIDWMISETNRCLPKLAISRDDILYSWAGVNPLTSDPEEPLGSREIKVHDLAPDGMPNLLALTGGPIMTHRRVARRLVKEITGRLSPTNTPQRPDYQGAQILSGQKGATSISADKVERCVHDEMPRSLTDLLMRRLGLGWEPDQGVAQARSIAEVAAPHMGWSDARVDAELHAYQNHLAKARRRPDAM
ncbi:FAD-dependent oxidoreductase [Parasedimentitalea marina]|uniref:FAD-dependent oxidoreductase n=1 Tax=Parasedimentitalea marina TaxID=2483033 RepID=A0A3T0N3P6_9RHOB|nr:FAD-dependent oxidoreductase [Parasedimentitalea marina]